MSEHFVLVTQRLNVFAGLLGGKQNNRMQGTLTPYEPIEVAVMTVLSPVIKRLLKGAPDPYRSAAARSRAEHLANP